jgi:hypothetical protein
MNHLNPDDVTMLNELLQSREGKEAMVRIKADPEHFNSRGFLV